MLWKIFFKYKYYRILKTGFLLDFFIKNLFIYLFKNLVLVFNWYFYDKYLLELQFFKIVINYKKIFIKIQKLTHLTFFENIKILLLIQINLILFYFIVFFFN